MPRASSGALLAALLSGAVVCGVPQSSGAVAVDGSFERVTTRIAVKLDDRLSSQDNKTGDVFTFELSGSVFVNGVAIGAGTRGHGVVTAVRSGEGPKRGSLELAARSIDLPGGGHIPVGLAPGSLDLRPGRDARGFSVPLGGPVPIYIGTARDNNIVYEKGTPFTVVAPPPATPEPDATTSP